MYRRHTKEAESSFRNPSPELDNPFSGNGHVPAQLHPDTQYALLFEQNPQPMFVCDRESMKFLVVNEAAIRMYGFSREEFLELTLLDIRPPEFISRFKDSFAATDALESFGLASPTGDWKHRKKDGTVFDVEIYCSRTTFQGRDARLGVVNDVSARKQAEQALRENQERLEAALHASETGTFRWCFKTDFVFTDGNLDQLFGLRRGTGRQKLETFFHSIHPDDRPSVNALIEHCRKTGTNFDMEFRVVWPDQTVHWLSDKGRVFFDDQGNPRYMTGACVDISARKLADEKLRQDEERLRMILENVRDHAIFSLDLQGNIMTWNLGAENVFGHSEHEIVGKPFALLFTPEDQHKGEPEHEITMAAQADFSPEDRWYLHKNGTCLFASGTVRPLTDNQGRLQGFIKVARNITDRKQVQEQLEARLQQQATVAQLGQVALAGGDDQKLMDEAVVLVTKTLNIELSKVLELLPGDEQLLLRAGVGWMPGKVGHAVVPLGRESQAGYTLASDKPVISDDLPTEKRFKVL
jgi:PAS domain S-box-containing protein